MSSKTKGEAEQEDVNMVAFIDYTQKKIANLERSAGYSIAIIVFSVVQVFALLQYNLPDRPNDRIFMVQKNYLSFILMNEPGIKPRLFMTLMFTMIFANALSTLFIVNYIKKYD
jgi:hypothetical protein